MFLRRKAMISLVAISLVAIFVTGTFAWTNFGSQMINVFRGAGNPTMDDGLGDNDGPGENNTADRPGGTLHNNFVPDESYKTVFVENWGNENIFVRIRLDEYMEIGPGAGLMSDTTDAATGQAVPNPENHATPLVSEADINDAHTWTTHIPASSVYECDTGFHDYWEWGMGGSEIYYFPAPVDQRETDSFIASESTNEGLTADCINDAGVGTQRTANANVITIAEWNESQRIGNYWVFDTDGWAYWASPIMPGEATGLLLNGVTLTNNNIDGHYFYAVNVNAQMATSKETVDDGNVSNFRDFGFDINGGWTEDGMNLMYYITGNQMLEVQQRIDQNITSSINVLDWQLLHPDGSIASDTAPMIQGAPRTRFAFQWETNFSGGQVVQEGDWFSFRLPHSSTFAPNASLAFLHSDWQGFNNPNSNIMGQWRIHNQYVYVMFSGSSVGQAHITGWFETGQVVNNLVVTGGLHDVVFGDIARTIQFTPRLLNVETVNQRMSRNQESASMINWWTRPNTLGARELTGHTLDSGGSSDVWGTNFTIQQGTEVENVLVGRFVAASFSIRLPIPINLEQGYATNMGGAQFPGSTVTRRMTQLYQDMETGEGYAAFRNRVRQAPWQWGVWANPADGVQTFISYFGTLGVDGPRNSEINADFAMHAANHTISLGYYSETQRDALIDYFTRVYGDGNVIGGRAVTMNIFLNEGFAPVRQETVRTNEVTITRNGVPMELRANGTNRPMDGQATFIPAGVVRLTLRDQETHDRLPGAQFSLQTVQPGVGWVSVPGRTYTTDSNGQFETNVGFGVFRFAQDTVSDPQYELENPAHNSFNAELGRPASDYFTLNAGSTGYAVIVENVRTLKWD